MSRRGIFKKCFKKEGVAVLPGIVEGQQARVKGRFRVSAAFLAAGQDVQVAPARPRVHLFVRLGWFSLSDCLLGARHRARPNA